ncbi:hypothetical protein CDCA_CDCA06G1874 [Cyanidium caldarium]|uniref:RFTS domain-containing protein n=1 Tax=Cyanidium caldarium TaxID=2771 RepID=A0AAV9IUN6_CYACA|nr:hypothetical protein CDCA_CDCA06G1874 [Cyanidium caldarium]
MRRNKRKAAVAAVKHITQALNGREASPESADSEHSGGGWRAVSGAGGGLRAAWPGRSVRSRTAVDGARRSQVGRSESPSSSEKSDAVDGESASESFERSSSSSSSVSSSVTENGWSAIGRLGNRRRRRGDGGGRLQRRNHRVHSVSRRPHPVARGDKRARTELPAPPPPDSLAQPDDRDVDILSVRDMWQLPAAWRLLQTFSTRLGIVELTPPELEHALEEPQYHPALAEALASLVGHRSPHLKGSAQRSEWVQRADDLWFPAFAKYLATHADDLIAQGLHPSSVEQVPEAAPEWAMLQTGGWEAFLQLTPRQRLLILYALCEHVLCSFEEHHRYLHELRQLQEDDLRIQPVGVDRYGRWYWYFDDNCRLYREHGVHRPEQVPPGPVAADHNRDGGGYVWEVAAEGVDSLRELIGTLNDHRAQSTERALRRWLERELLPLWEELGRKLERESRRREKLERLLATKRTSSRVMAQEEARRREEEERRRREEEQRYWELQRKREEAERRTEAERIERAARRQQLEMERALRAAERNRELNEAPRDTERRAASSRAAALIAGADAVAPEALPSGAVPERHVPPELNFAAGAAENDVEELSDEAVLPYRLLTSFRVIDGSSGADVPLDALDDMVEASAASTLCAQGMVVAAADAARHRPLLVRTGPIQEWCIDYGEVCIWIRTACAWYRLVAPHAAYAKTFSSTRRKFELAVRVSILCSTLPSPECTFRNMSALLAMRYGSMRRYSKEEVIQEARFLVEQAELLGRPEMLDNAFMRRLRREIAAADARVRMECSKAPPTETEAALVVRLRLPSTETSRAWSVAASRGPGLWTSDCVMSVPRPAAAAATVAGAQQVLHAAAETLRETPARTTPKWSVAAGSGPGLWASHTPALSIHRSTSKRASDRRRDASIWSVAASRGPGLWHTDIERYSAREGAVAQRSASIPTATNKTSPLPIASPTPDASPLWPNGSVGSIVLPAQRTAPEAPSTPQAPR